MRRRGSRSPSSAQACRRSPEPTACRRPGLTFSPPPDEGKRSSSPITAAASTSYAPNLTPVYALTDQDFVDEKGNKDPVSVERADVFSLPTIQRVEVSSRSNRYSPVPVEARDQSQIELYGPRVGSAVQAHEICDEHVIGPIVAQTILQRELYVRHEVHVHAVAGSSASSTRWTLCHHRRQSRLSQLSRPRDRQHRGRRQGAR